nr:hypothetical protein CFP56_41443 [Quercus suber]
MCQWRGSYVLVYRVAIGLVEGDGSVESRVLRALLLHSMEPEVGMLSVSLHRGKAGVLAAGMTGRKGRAKGEQQREQMPGRRREPGSVPLAKAGQIYRPPIDDVTGRLQWTTLTVVMAL